MMNFGFGISAKLKKERRCFLQFKVQCIKAPSNTCRYLDKITLAFNMLIVNQKQMKFLKNSLKSVQNL